MARRGLAHEACFCCFCLSSASMVFYHTSRYPRTSFTLPRCLPSVFPLHPSPFFILSFIDVGNVSRPAVSSSFLSILTCVPNHWFAQKSICMPNHAQALPYPAPHRGSGCLARTTPSKLDVPQPHGTAAQVRRVRAILCWDSSSLE